MTAGKKLVLVNSKSLFFIMMTDELEIKFGDKDMANPMCTFHSTKVTTSKAPSKYFNFFLTFYPVFKVYLKINVFKDFGLILKMYLKSKYFKDAALFFKVEGVLYKLI
jgi:hypothetical protein